MYEFNIRNYINNSIMFVNWRSKLRMIELIVSFSIFSFYGSCKSLSSFYTFLQWTLPRILQIYDLIWINILFEFIT